MKALSRCSDNQSVVNPRSWLARWPYMAPRGTATNQSALRIGTMTSPRQLRSCSPLWRHVSDPFPWQAPICFNLLLKILHSKQNIMIFVLHTRDVYHNSNVCIRWHSITSNINSQMCVRRLFSVFCCYYECSHRTTYGLLWCSRWVTWFSGLVLLRHNCTRLSLWLPLRSQCTQLIG